LRQAVHFYNLHKHIEDNVLWELVWEITEVFCGCLRK